MYASPEARGHRDHCAQNGLGAPRGMFNGGIYPTPSHFRIPMGPEHHQPTHPYGSSFETSAAQAQAQAHARSETGVPSPELRHPFEFYPHFPYGFTPWQVGHSLPRLSFYPVTSHERWEEKPAEEPMETKVELSSPELLSSFETQLTEPHMGDLIVSELLLFKNGNVFRLTRRSMRTEVKSSRLSTPQKPSALEDMHKLVSRLPLPCAPQRFLYNIKPGWTD